MAARKSSQVAAVLSWRSKYISIPLRNPEAPSKVWYLRRRTRTNRTWASNMEESRKSSTRVPKGQSCDDEGKVGHRTKTAPDGFSCRPCDNSCFKNSTDPSEDLIPEGRLFWLAGITLRRKNAKKCRIASHAHDLCALVVDCGCVEIVHSHVALRADRMCHGAVVFCKLP